ncbi:MAG: hypothetical protein JNK46_01490, partial [Methylobacteriaceae bacterium]|nr:hypothetical protein [Methylobacteriaceae bacterium]
MTAAATSRPAGPAVGALAVASGVVLAALPVGMALANRSAPASLVVAALLAVAALAAGPGFGAAAAPARALVDRQTTRLAFAFAGLALLSLLWSVDRARSLRTMVELAPVLVAGLALALCFPTLARPWLGRALAGGIAVAAAVVLIEAGFALPWRRLIGARLDAADLKRAVTPLAILLWPVIPLLPP